jgi:hypothetical protein
MREIEGQKELERSCSLAISLMSVIGSGVNSLTKRFLVHTEAEHGRRPVDYVSYILSRSLCTSLVLTCLVPAVPGPVCFRRHDDDVAPALGL